MTDKPVSYGGKLGAQLALASAIPFLMQSAGDEKKFVMPQPTEPLKPCKICGVQSKKVCCSGDHYREWIKKIK